MSEELNLSFRRYNYMLHIANKSMRNWQAVIRLWIECRFGVCPPKEFLARLTLVFNLDRLNNRKILGACSLDLKSSYLGWSIGERSNWIGKCLESAVTISKNDSRLRQDTFYWNVNPICHEKKGNTMGNLRLTPWCKGATYYNQSGRAIKWNGTPDYNSRLFGCVTIF